MKRAFICVRSFLLACLLTGSLVGSAYAGSEDGSCQREWEDSSAYDTCQTVEVTGRSVGWKVMCTIDARCQNQWGQIRGATTPITVNLNKVDSLVNCNAHLKIDNCD